MLPSTWENCGSEPGESGLGDANWPDEPCCGNDEDDGGNAAWSWERFAAEKDDGEKGETGEGTAEAWCPVCHAGSGIAEPD
jgi:hypothetical protein